jgi:hypothetical protein
LLLDLKPAARGCRIVWPAVSGHRALEMQAGRGKLLASRSADAGLASRSADGNLAGLASRSADAGLVSQSAGGNLAGPARPPGRALPGAWLADLATLCWSERNAEAAAFVTGTTPEMWDQGRATFRGQAAVVARVAATLGGVPGIRVIDQRGQRVTFRGRAEIPASPTGPTAPVPPPAAPWARVAPGHPTAPPAPVAFAAPSVQAAAGVRADPDAGIRAPPALLSCGRGECRQCGERGLVDARSGLCAACADGQGPGGPDWRDDPGAGAPEDDGWPDGAPAPGSSGDEGEDDGPRGGAQHTAGRRRLRLAKRW